MIRIRPAQGRRGERPRAPWKTPDLCRLSPATVALSERAVGLLCCQQSLYSEMGG